MKGQPRIVMKKHRRLTAKITVLILSAVLLFGSVPVNVFAATGFEQSISAFPESYKVKLRALHEKYPKWSKTAALAIGYREGDDKERIFVRTCQLAKRQDTWFRHQATAIYVEPTVDAVRACWRERGPWNVRFMI